MGTTLGGLARKRARSAPWWIAMVTVVACSTPDTTQDLDAGTDDAASPNDAASAVDAGSIAPSDAASAPDSPTVGHDAAPAIDTGACTMCDDFCVDPLNDPMYCGGCSACTPYPNAAPYCENGHCVIGPCSGYFEDCDGDPSNGCETAGPCPSGATCLALDAPCGTNADCCGHDCQEPASDIGVHTCSATCNPSGAPCEIDDTCCSAYCDGATNTCN